MPITLLRWKGGSGGDTLLKLLLESNRDLHSQVQFSGDHIDSSRSWADIKQLDDLDQISKMARNDCADTDFQVLCDQLTNLQLQDPKKSWLLKTHCYFEFNWPVVDLAITPTVLPFVVKSNLIKNSREKNLVPNYNKMTEIIRDPDVLYKFDCYNTAVDSYSTRLPEHTTKIFIDDMINGWNRLKQATDSINLSLGNHCRQYYENWLAANQQYMPSTSYLKMIDSGLIDHTYSGLDLEEKYCMLAMENKRFVLL